MILQLLGLSQAFILAAGALTVRYNRLHTEQSFFGWLVSPSESLSDQRWIQQLTCSRCNTRHWHKALEACRDARIQLNTTSRRRRCVQVKEKKRSQGAIISNQRAPVTLSTGGDSTARFDLTKTQLCLLHYRRKLVSCHRC